MTQEGWFARLDCPTAGVRGWIVVVYRRGGPALTPCASRRDALEELARADDATLDGGFESFAYPVDFHGPDTWIIVWSEGEVLDQRARGFATRTEAMLALAAVYDADRSDPEAARRAAELRRFAAEA